MKTLYTFILLVIVKLCQSIDPACDTTSQINEWKRSVAYAPTENDPEICDSFLKEGWYKISSKAGDKMPTTCPVGGFRCCTTSPIWLSDENVPKNEPLYPKEDNMVVNRVACSSYFDGNCCKEKLNIKIKNCKNGKYFVYYLTPPSSCNTAYCFGDQIPCPAGTSSETGFQPGCGTYPRITVKPSVKPGLNVRRRNDGGFSHNMPFAYETVKFTCEAATLLPTYTCNIRWYINDFLIDAATRRNVRANNLQVAMLLQEDWETTFKPTMTVKCSIQIKDTAFQAPGPEQFSDDFIAGLIVDQSQKEFSVEEGATVEIPVKLTIPLGCSYPTINQMAIESIKKTSCVLNLITSVPTYMNDPDSCKDNMDGITFQSQQCGIAFNSNGWYESQIVRASGTLDGIVNLDDRIAVVKLYNDNKAASSVPELELWKGIMLPEIKIRVRDKDENLLGKTCSSNNDPHMSTFEGRTFSFHLREGEYILYRHKRLPVQIHGYYRKCNGEALCNCGVAVRSGDSAFVANFCNVKGRENRYVTQKMCKEGEIKVEESNNKNSYTITTISGTQVSVTLGQVYRFFGINSLAIQASALDQYSTEGLCGSVNNDRRDDLKTQNGQIFDVDNSVIEELGTSWRVINQEESIFNIYTIRPAVYHPQQYCTCKKESNRYPFGPPDMDCNLKDTLAFCTHFTLKTTSVYHAPCKHRTYETKRRRSVRSDEEIESVKHADDEAPEMFLMDVNDGEEGKLDMSWKNGWNEAKARNYCTNHFKSSAAFAVCSNNVPSVHLGKFVEECVKDIQIAGDTSWLDVSLNNFGSACLNDAKKMENLTRTNATGENSAGKSIFSIIAESTCPKNCSEHGRCEHGVCNCTGGYFGSSCERQENEAPELLVEGFDGLCDISAKPCKKYVIPGLHFMNGNLTCKYRPFTIHTNITINSKIIEYVQGEYISMFSMRCPAPSSRHKRSVNEIDSALGYHVSVSNDGENFTREMPIIVYDSNCLICNASTLTCEMLATCPTLQQDTTTTNVGLQRNQSERHDVSCNSDSMSVFIPSTLLSQNETLSWRDPHCTVTNNGTHYVSVVSHTACGTTVKFTDSEVIFENDLIIRQSTSLPVSSHNDIVDFGGAYSEIIPVKCVYPRRQNVTTAYIPAQTRVRFFEKRYGHMDVELEQYHSDKFDTVIRDITYPREVPINQDMYIKLHTIHNSSDIAIKVDSCVATPSIMPADGQLYPLIDHGCPASPAVKLYPSAFNEVKFSVHAFEFKSSPGSVVYIHCQISVCLAKNPQCVVGCRSRQRREVSAADDSSHLVSGGPYLLVAEQGSVQMATIVAAVCACLAVVATIVAAVGWRRKLNAPKHDSKLISD